MSARGFVSTALALAMSLVTSLAQQTHDVQSATECDSPLHHVTERLDDVTERLTRLRSDVMLALRSATSGQSAGNCHCEASNATQLLQADVAFIRRTVETLNVPRRSPTNHSAHAGKLQILFFSNTSVYHSTSVAQVYRTNCSDRIKSGKRTG